MALYGITSLKANGSRHAKPLARHLIALCLALVLPVIVLGGLLAWSYAEGERARLEQDALGIAHEIVAATDRELSDLIATTKVLALSRSLQRGDLDAFDAQARDVYQQIGINVVLRDLQSHQLVNTRLPKGAPLPTNVETESDNVVMETRRPFVSNLFIGAVTRKPLFIINVPVLRGGEIVYFLNLSLEPERMREVLLQGRLPKNWTATVVDRRGFVVAHSSYQHEMLNQQLPPSIWRAAALRDGTMAGVNPAGEHDRVLIAYARSELAGWMVVVTVPYAQIVEPARRLMMAVAGIGGGILVLSLGLALIFAQRIKQAVAALAVQAAALGKTKSAKPLETRVSEVNELSKILLAEDAERQGAEKSLRDSEARLQLAQSAGRIGTWEWDVQNARAQCSDSYRELYGLDPKGPGHQAPEDWLAQVHPEDRDRVMNEWRSALVSGRLESEYRIVRPDGSVRWIVDRGIPIFDSEGHPTRFIGVNVDVTERKESEQRLRELQLELLHASRLSAMGQMAAGLAHELNQPLGAAANFMSAARLALKTNKADAAERVPTRIDKAIEQTVRAGAILSRLRDYISKGETDKRITNARQLLQDAVALALVGAKDPTLRVRFDFQDRDRQLLVDRIQIQQVVFNLVRNAIEATEGKKVREIVLATRSAADDELEISVADTGSGLPDDAESVFQPFVTSKTTGMGVGLSICRTIVNAHGGRLWAEARAGGGAVFRFTLPTAMPRE